MLKRPNPSSILNYVQYEPVWKRQLPGFEDAISKIPDEMLKTVVIPLIFEFLYSPCDMCGQERFTRRYYNKMHVWNCYGLIDRRIPVIQPKIRCLRCAYNLRSTLLYKKDHSLKFDTTVRIWSDKSNAIKLANDRQEELICVSPSGRSSYFHMENNDIINGNIGVYQTRLVNWIVGIKKIYIGKE